MQARFDELGGYALERARAEILAGLGFRAEVVDGDVGTLSGGWKMRVALARILLMRPDALLLDEPTNHLDIESIIWLEGFLRDFEGALVDDLARSRVHEPRRHQDRRDRRRRAHDLLGQLRLLRAAARASRAAQHEAQYARQQAMLAKEEAFIERFKARASHAAQVQSRVKKLDKIEKVEPPRRRKVVEFDFRPPPRSGDDVAQARGRRARRYGDAHASTTGSTCSSAARERWCVMGVNGAGKSTLLKLVAGETAAGRGQGRRSAPA